MSSTSSTHRKALIGSPPNFWLHSSRTGFDLTRPLHSSASTSIPNLTIQTTTSPITISPETTALLIIDMQNFFLSPLLGHSPSSPGHAACKQLIERAIPAARKAGIRIVWVNWGLTDAEVREMPAGVKRAFGFHSVPEGSDDKEVHSGEDIVADGAVQSSSSSSSVGVDKHGRVKTTTHKGIGSDMGLVKTEAGDAVRGGRLLVRDSWNADIYPPLHALYSEGSKLPSKADVWVHKNRMSGLWGATTPLQQVLEKEGITTLLFAGVNTDQCVGGTLTDAFSKGYDCVLLSDGCGTSSPGFAQECWEYNAAHTFGFCASCEDLARGVEGMGKV